MCVFGGGVGAAPRGPGPGRTSILQLVALRGPDFGQWLLLAVAGAALNSRPGPGAAQTFDSAWIPPWWRFSASFHCGLPFLLGSSLPRILPSCRIYLSLRNLVPIGLPRGGKGMCDFQPESLGYIPKAASSIPEPSTRKRGVTASASENAGLMGSDTDTRCHPGPVTRGSCYFPPWSLGPEHSCGGHPLTP